MRHVAPRIYHLHPLVAGPLRGWDEQFERIARLGFDWVCLAPPFLPDDSGDIFLPADWEALHPALLWDGTADAALAFAAAAATRAGLRIMLDIRLDRIARSSGLRRQHVGWFQDGLPEGLPDPRRPPRRRDASYARFDQTEVADGLGDWWSSRLTRLVDAGVGGLRCLAPARTPATVWRRLFGDLRQRDASALLLGWTVGLERAAIRSLESIGFDRVTPSPSGCHRLDAQFVEEADALRRVAPLIGSPEASFEDRLVRSLLPGVDVVAACRQALHVAAAVGNGLFMPMGFEFATRVAFDASRATPGDLARARDEAAGDLAADVAEAIALAGRLGEMGIDGAVRALTPPGAAEVGFLRANAADVRDATAAVVVVVNRTSRAVDAGALQGSALPPQAGAAFGSPTPLDPRIELDSPLEPGEVRVIAYHRPRDVVQSPPPDLDMAAIAASRVALEAVSPTVPDGDFPVKTIVGAALTVSADIFAEGHDVLSAALLWRAADENDWRTVAFHPVGNDRWEASFTPVRLGGHLYSIEAWWDGWATFRHDLQVKHRAGQLVDLEVSEGRKLVEAACAEAEAGTASGAAGGAGSGAASVAASGAASGAPNETADRAALAAVPVGTTSASANAAAGPGSRGHSGAGAGSGGHYGATARATAGARSGAIAVAESGASSGADTRARPGNQTGSSTSLRVLRDRLVEADEAERIELLLAPETLALMQAADRRQFLARLPAPIRVHVDRPQASFASWYELFPRSVTTDPARHGTFRDVIGRLPAIREMGFDVLYFPPVHPIGKTNRKGRNNALKASER